MRIGGDLARNFIIDVYQNIDKDYTSRNLIFATRFVGSKDHSINSLLEKTFIIFILVRIYNI